MRYIFPCSPARSFCCIDCFLLDVVAMAQAVSIVVAGASMAALASQPTFRANLIAALSRWTGFGEPGGAWRIAAILLALANLKNLPFVWHVRCPIILCSFILMKCPTTASILPRSRISHLPSTDPYPTTRALPAHHHIDANTSSRNRLQHAQVQ